MERHFQDQVLKDWDGHLDCFPRSFAVEKANCHVMGNTLQRGPQGTLQPQSVQMTIAWGEVLSQSQPPRDSYPTETTRQYVFVIFSL